jgi:hypothetical protein
MFSSFLFPRVQKRELLSSLEYVINWCILSRRFSALRGSSKSSEPLKWQNNISTIWAYSFFSNATLSLTPSEPESVSRHSRSQIA